MSGKVISKILKVFLWLFAGIFFLILSIAVALQVPAVQQKIAQKAVAFLRDKLDTEVELKSLSISFPKSLNINGFYLADKNNDTLWYNESLEIDVNMFALLSNKLQINRLQLEGGTIHLTRTMPDSTFNFDFITEAFSTRPDTIKKDTTASEFIFDIGKIRFKDIYFTFKDEVAGTNLLFNIGRFNIDTDEIDPATSLYTVDNIRLLNTTVDVVTYKESVEEESGPINVQFGFNTIDLSAVKFSFENKINRNTISTSIGKSSIKADDVDLRAQTINLQNVELYNTEASFVIDKLITKDTIEKKIMDPVTSEPDETREAGWFIKVKNLDFKDNEFVFTNHNDIPQNSGIDFSHLLASNIDIDIDDLFYSSQRISAKINNFALKEKSGFVLEQLTTNLLYDSVKAELSDLRIKTTKSEIGNYIALEYKDISRISQNLAATGIRADLKNSKISYEDILYFNPSLAHQRPFSQHPNEILNINTEISGNVGNLEIGHLQLSTLSSTKLNIRGSISGLPEVKNANYNIVIRELTTSSADAYSLAPANIIPENISIPPSINLAGYFHGNLSNFRSQFNLKTTYGNAIANANVTGGSAENFILSTAIRDFDLGRFLKQDTTFGIVDLNFEAEGSGLKPERMNATYSGILNHAEIKDYTYKDLEFKGGIKDKLLATSAIMNDKNLIFTLESEISVDTANPKYYIDFNLAGADLQALHFTEDDLRVSFKFKADLDGYNMNDVNGEVSLHNVLIVKNDEQYSIDSLLYASVSKDQNKSIKVDSDFISGEFKGTMGIFDLPEAVKRHFNNYFPMDLDPADEPVSPQNFSFNLTIHNPEILSDVLIPQLQSIKPGNISGDFNSEVSELNVQISVPRIVYSDINIDTLIIDLSSDPDNLYINAHIAHITNPTLNIENPTLIITMANDTIQTIFQIVDEQSKEEKYLLAGNIVKAEEQMRLSLFPNGVKLYYEKWMVEKDNYVLFGNKQLYFHNLKLSKDNQYILVTNTGNDFSSPVEFSLNDFHVPVLARIINDEYSLFGGIINGNIIFSNLQAERPVAFTANLSVEDFSFKSDTVGVLKLTADNEGAGRYNLNLDIDGHGNDLTASGYYSSQAGKSNINFDLDINYLNLSTIESFTLGHLTSMSGGIEGELKLTGDTEKPNFIGFIQFSNSSFNLSYLNSVLTLADERIIFTEQGINFNNLTIKDSLNNTANIRGFLYTNHFKDFRFAMDISTRDFLALNTKEKDDILYFGTVFLDSDIRIRGDANQPVVNMTARIKEDSDFTLVLPKDEIAIIERKGIIEFVDYTGRYSKIMTRKKETEDTVRTELSGIDLNANIEINKDSKFKIVVDEAAGDSLVLFGDATLSFGIDPSGKISLTGRYEIAEGTYQMTFYVRRKFDIQQGSSLTWTGNPLDADVDITAIYEVKTAPIDLMADQISGTEETEQNRYKQKMPFNVILNMEGELLTPEISFDIEVAPEDRGGEVSATVATKLDQLSTNESELNKQVFALLVLERFLPEDPLAISGSGGGAESLARESASRILGQQLNRLAGRHIKGVELNVGLESYQDYSTGQATGRTELAVGVSKQFLNERVTVSIGSNFDLEGERARKSNLSTVAGDISVEYKLTEDGRFRLRGFRESIYESILEGEVVETGVGIIYTKDYNKFKNLFRRIREDNTFERKGDE